MGRHLRDPTAFCSECRIHYPDYMSYAAHRTRKMKAGEGHIHCEICSSEFTRRETLDRHHKQEHPQEQDLNCPGCHLHFTRLGSLFNHIESNTCFKIGKEDIEYARWDRSRMSRGLAQGTGEDPKEYFGKFLGIGSNVTDNPATGIGSKRRFLGHIKPSISVDPVLSTLGSSGRDTECSNLSVGAQSSLAQPIQGPDLRSASLDTTEFPAPAESGASEKQTGSESPRAGSPDAIIKGKSPEGSSLANEARNTEAQHISGPDLRPGIFDTTEFLTLAEASGNKGNAECECHNVGIHNVSIFHENNSEEPPSSRVKMLRDSRWALNKTTATSSHHVQSRRSDLHTNRETDTPKTPVKADQARNVDLSCNTNEAAAAPLFELHQQRPDSLLQAAYETPAEQAKTVPDQHHPSSPGGGFSYIREALAGRVEQLETTSCFSEISKSTPGDSLKTVPPHLRAKILRASPTDYSQISNFSVDCQPVPVLPPHLQGGLGAGLTAAYPEASKGQNDGSTIKHSDQGTMGLPPAKSGESRGSSALPPHLRRKMNDVFIYTDGGSPETQSSNGGVPLDCLEKPSHAVAASAEANKTRLNLEPTILTGQSTISGVDSCSELEPAQSSRPRELIGSAHDDAGLPPHIRRKPGHAVAALPTIPAETDYSPTPSMSTGQSTSEPVDTGRESWAGQAPHPRGNFGVVQSISYATVAQDSEKLPPHLRGKEGTSPSPPTNHDVTDDAATEIAPMSHRSKRQDAITQTEHVTAILQRVTLKPTDTSVHAINVMGSAEEGLELGPHDPQHPTFDARNYRSQYTGRYHCPITMCGKGFKSMQGIVGHLASDVHRRPLMKLQCPHCLRYFNSTAALTQHSESQSRKCEIRNTSEFRPFLDQLTAGIADVEGIHGDQTNRYIVTEEAMYQYGDEEMRGRVLRVFKEQERKQIEDKEGNYYDGKNIAW